MQIFHRISTGRQDQLKRTLKLMLMRSRVARKDGTFQQLRTNYPCFSDDLAQFLEAYFLPVVAKDGEIFPCLCLPPNPLKTFEISANAADGRLKKNVSSNNVSKIPLFLQGKSNGLQHLQFLPKTANFPVAEAFATNFQKGRELRMERERNGQMAEKTTVFFSKKCKISCGWDPLANSFQKSATNL